MSRLFTLLICLALPSLAHAQVAFVSVKSADTALGDFRHVAKLAGFDDALTQLDALLKESGARDLEGVDRTRPLGVCFLWPKELPAITDLSFPAVAFVPVSDEKKFFDLLLLLDVKVKRGDKRHTITLPDGMELALRFEKGYAFAGEKLPDSLPDPASFLPKNGQKTSLQASVLFENVPKEHVKLLEEAGILAKLGMSFVLNEEERKKPGETDDEYRKRIRPIKELKETVDWLFKTGFASFIAQAREITLTVDVEPKQHQLTAEVALVPREGKKNEITDWAKMFGGTRGRFAPLVAKSDVGGWFNLPSPLDPKDAKAGADELADYFKSLFVGKDDEEIGKLLKVVFTTLRTDGVDAGFTWQGEGDDFTLLFGVKVQQGKVLDTTLAKVYKDLPKEQREMLPIKWGEDKHGAARIHKLTADGEEGYLAIRDDVVLLGFGKSPVKVIKEMLDAFGKKEAVASPVAGVSATSKFFLINETLAKAIEKDVPKADREKVRAKMSLEGGKDIRLRIEASTHLLRLLKQEE